MKGKIIRSKVPVRRNWIHPNRIFFPSALRQAIPDLPTCVGRDLVLDSVGVRALDSLFLGRHVRLDLLTKETGKLTGEFTVNVSMSADAARALAETLLQAAERAKSAALR